MSVLGVCALPCGGWARSEQGATDRFVGDREQQLAMLEPETDVTVGVEGLIDGERGEIAADLSEGRGPD